MKLYDKWINELASAASKIVMAAAIGGAVIMSAGNLQFGNPISNISLTSSIASTGLLGSGSDGAVIISANTVLTRDMFYSSLTVNTGVLLNTASFAIHCTGTISLPGTATIQNIGGAGGLGNVATAGTAGVGAIGGAFLGGTNGGVGGSGGAGVGAAGSNGIASTVPGSGGGPGGQGSPINAGGIGGIGGNAANTRPATWFGITSLESSQSYSGGAGGGGGGGGGIAFILCGTSTFTGSTTANGGIGGAAGTGSAPGVAGTNGNPGGAALGIVGS